MSNIRERVIKLRELMKEKGIDVYVIPSSDYHQSEYVGEHFKSREFISGFTGSAGIVVVTENEAGLWTDGRYFIQAEKQLEESTIILFKMGEENVPTYIEYIGKNLKNGQCLGFDGKVLSGKNVFDIKAGFGKKEIKIEDKLERALADHITAFPMAVLKASETFKPNIIADYLFELSKKFNSFYNSCPILNQEDEILYSRALIAKMTGETIKDGLSLLGIKTLDRM